MSVRSSLNSYLLSLFITLLILFGKLKIIRLSKRSCRAFANDNSLLSEVYEPGITTLKLSNLTGDCSRSIIKEME